MRVPPKRMKTSEIIEIAAMATVDLIDGAFCIFFSNFLRKIPKILIGNTATLLVADGVHFVS